MNDLFARMCADADRVVLARPAAIRRIGTRRTRVKVVTVAVAVLTVIAGSAVTANSYLAGGRSRVVPGGSPTPSTVRSPSASPGPSASVSASASPVVASRPSDPCSRDVQQCYPPARFFYEEKLPAPCATTSHPSESRKLARKSAGWYPMVSGEDGRLIGPDDVGVSPATTGFGETLTRYSGNGAAQYLAEVVAAVGRCSSVRRSTGETQPGTLVIRYRLVSRDTLGGDQSLLLSRTYTSFAGEQTFPIAVVRVGDVVVVLMDYGWESTPSIPRSFDEFLARSVAEGRRFTG